MTALNHFYKTSTKGFYVAIAAGLSAALMISYTNLFTFDVAALTAGTCLGLFFYTDDKIKNLSTDTSDLILMQALHKKEVDIYNFKRLKVRPMQSIMAMSIISLVCILTTATATISSIISDTPIYITGTEVITVLFTCLFGIFAAYAYAHLSFKSYDKAIKSELNAFEAAHPELDDIIERGEFAEKYLN